MKTARHLSRNSFAALLATLCLVAGCGDDTPATTNDAGSTQDVSTVQDSGVPSDSGAPADGGTPADSGLPPLPTMPRVVAASAAGHDRLFAATHDPAGNIVAVGSIADGTDAMTADFRTLVARFNPSGEVDATFGTNGFASYNIAPGLGGEVARGVVVQSTGRIVLLSTVEHAGATDARDRDIALVRFNANGTRDTTFGTNGAVILDLSAGELVGTTYVADGAWGLTAYSDDRLLIMGSQKRTGGTDTDFAVVRLSADGARDATFGTNGVATVDINNRSANARTVTILSDGSIVGTGYMDDGGVVKPVLFKLSSTGTPVMGFGTNGVFAPTVLAAATESYAIALQGSSFITAGYGRNAATESLDWLSLRVTAAGALDTTYGVNGVARLDLAMFNDNARNVVVLPDNRVLIVGGGRPTESNIDGMLAMLTANGQPDTSFGARGIRTFDFGGASDMLWGASLSPDRSRVAVVGVRAVAAGMGNDDCVVHVISAR